MSRDSRIFPTCKINAQGSSLVAQRVKDLALSLLWHRFDPMTWVRPKTTTTKRKALKSLAKLSVPLARQTSTEMCACLSGPRPQNHTYTGLPSPTASAPSSELEDRLLGWDPQVGWNKNFLFSLRSAVDEIFSTPPRLSEPHPRHVPWGPEALISDSPQIGQREQT